MAFTAPVDIVNRACQHLGVDRILAAEFTTATTKQGGELTFMYEKVRRAELRRNLWRYAMKRAVLYPIDLTTMLFQPGVWLVGQTYFPGAVVADSAGDLWTSNLNNNIGNAPGLGSAVWDHYFGAVVLDQWQNPLTIAATNSSTLISGQPNPVSTVGYYTGDVVYVNQSSPFPAGTINVYRSLSTVNTDNPQVPDQWVATTTYYQNQVVQYLNVLYISLLNGNINQNPLSQTSWWQVYVPTYSAGATYAAGAFVIASSVLYQSRVSGNIGNTPASSPTQWMTMNAAWAVGTTYNLNQTVIFGGIFYQSTVASNLGHTPGVDGNWTSVATNQAYGSLNWLQLPSTTTIAPLAISYPLNAGPASQTGTSNVFRLPNKYLRVAPDDPRGDIYAWLGAPTGNTPHDWLFEGDYIVSRDVYPIVFRFVGDVQDVTRMDDMFCEGFATRLAMDACETITQKSDMKQALRQIYKEVMGEARIVNGIETGSVAIPQDEYISVRI